MSKLQEKQLKVARDLKRNTWATNKITTIKRKVISDPPPVSDKSSSGCCSAAAALRQHTGSSGAYNATTKQDGRVDGSTSNDTHPCLHEYAASTVPLAKAEMSWLMHGDWSLEVRNVSKIRNRRGQSAEGQKWPKNLLLEGADTVQPPPHWRLVITAQNPAPGGR